MTKDELIEIYTTRVALLSQIKQAAIDMGDIDRVLKTDADMQAAEAELVKLKA